MLTILNNGIDITNNVNKNSVGGTLQLQNRSDVASFKTFDVEVKEGSIIDIWEGCTIREPFIAGGNVFEISDTFSISEKFRPGSKIYIDFDGVNKKVAYIQSVDHTNRTITTTKNINNNYGIGVKIGSWKFSGVVQKAPETELTRGDETNPILERTVNVGDYRQLFDRKVVVDTYENMYFREILSRIIYKFCATDLETDLVTFETVGTGLGIINTIFLDLVDRIQGNNSLSFGTSGAGTGSMTYTIPTIDLSGFKKVRFFMKIKSGSGQFVNSIKFRIGSDPSNYLEFDIDKIGDEYDGHRGLESVTLSEPDHTNGTPNMSDIKFVQWYIDVSANLPSDAFHFDITQAFNGGITCNNSKRGSIIFQDVRLQYKKPSVAVESLAKKSGDFRHIDNDRDIHYYYQNGGDALSPFGLTDTSQNFGDLRIDIDITNLRNRQTVRGGEAPDENDYIQEEVTDGKETSRRLDYKPKDLRVYIGVGDPAVYTEYTVGVENLVDESTVDFVFNFNEKTLRKTDGVPVPEGHILRRIYKPYKPIRVRMQNNTSIMKMKALTGGDGIYDGPVISEVSIKTFQEARQRAKAELDTYKNPIVTITFKTNIDGLQPGQIIHIKDTDRKIDDNYMIQKMQWGSRSDDYRTYTITASTTLFGITEFLQLLLKRSERREIDVSEIVDIVMNIDEVIELEDIWTIRHNGAPRYVHSRNLPYNHTLTLTEGGTPNDGYVGFSEVF